jgi:succinoglycan biosynthesis protein ExoV
VKLHYFKDPRGNFGDDLNPWLWPRLLPGLLDDDDRELLIGIGTLLNHRLPSAKWRHIVGSGVGYGRSPSIDEGTCFHAVRGFESARILGLPDDRVITDPAVLLRTVPLPSVLLPRARFGLMLTGRSLQQFDWAAVCRRADVAFISCHWSVERVLQEIRRCDTLLTEAMHGAIVADALRVPWIAVTCSREVLAFKWRDWLSSVRMNYEPVHILPLYQAAARYTTIQASRNAIKRRLRASGVWSKLWSDPPPRNSTAEEIERAVSELSVATRSRPSLSDETLLVQHVERYLTLLRRLESPQERTARGSAAFPELQWRTMVDYSAQHSDPGFASSGAA